MTITLDDAKLTYSTVLSLAKRLTLDDRSKLITELADLRPDTPPSPATTMEFYGTMKPNPALIEHVRQLRSEWE